MSDVPLVLLGSTATGKTAVACEMARLLGAEIVSFDASCVYRGLDVGTAKPTAAQRALVAHYLIDDCDPRDAYSAGRFVVAAEAALAELAARGTRALLVGGTGMYLRALLRGLDPAPPRDPSVRARLESREAQRPGSLHRLLARLDPASAARIPARDAYRVLRALEHRLASGRSLSASRGAWRGGDRLAVRKIGLRLPRDVRASLIARRVDAMLRDGLVDEVRRLLAEGVPPDAPSFRALGYRDVVQHVEGRLSLGEVRERMILATVQYAKRQDTWFRGEPDVRWVDSTAEPAELPLVVERAMLAATDGTRSPPGGDGRTA